MKMLTNIVQVVVSNASACLFSCAWSKNLTFLICCLDNHFVIEAKTPESGRTLVIGFEGTNEMVRDERTKSKTHQF